MIRATALSVLVLSVACESPGRMPTSPTLEVDSIDAVPQLPVGLYAYTDALVPIPRHFLLSGTSSVIGSDNTPAGNVVTNAGATLGRVLFYDKRLSANNRISCASCHQQAAGFSDTARFSRGFRGVATKRRTMALANARFYRSGRFFWDERAASLEEQVLVPIQDPHEMGMDLRALEGKLAATSFYPALFAAAFASPEVSRERISRALAQFVRALVSSQSPFDSAYRHDTPDFSSFSAPAREGERLFNEIGCANCHRTTAHFADDARNTGLDASSPDSGAGRARFKPPSLRNIEVRQPYMHDGRFRTLDEVVAFYDSGVKPHAGLDLRLKNPDGSPRRLGLSAAQRAALVEFLKTLTDQQFLHAERFSDPFPARD